MLATQHLISRSDTAQEKAEQQSVSFPPRRLKNIIQRHQGKSSCRMPGRKTTRRMNGMKPGGIPFKQVDIRRNTAVYGQLVRTIYPDYVFQESNRRRNYNGSQYQSQRPLPIRFQKRISVRSRRYDRRNASHCGNKNFHSAIKKRGQPQMAFVRNQPGALIGIEKGIAYQNVPIGKLLGGQSQQYSPHGPENKRMFHNYFLRKCFQ